MHQNEEIFERKRISNIQSQILRCLNQQEFTLSCKPVMVSKGKQHSNVKSNRTINRCGCDTTNAAH